MSGIVEMELSALAHGGEALGRYGKQVVFVPYAIPGERVRARLVEQKASFARGEIVEIVERSPDRVEPPCPHFGPGRCGGCQLQHIAYERQLELKRLVVANQLERIGQLRGVPVLPTIPSPAVWGYRSHSTFSVLPGGELGFYGTDGRTLVPLETCLILEPDLLDLFEQVELGAEEVERIKLQIGSDPDDRMLIMQTRDDLAPEIETDFPISINLLLSDNEPVNLIGSPQVTCQILNRHFRVTAGSFFQVNQPATELLVELVLDALKLTGTETVLDLYSGVGLLTAFVAERAALVVSVESYPPAVSDADANLADLDNVELVEGSVEAVLADLEGPFDAVVLDPPRSGVSPESLDMLAQMAAPILVYISCDPATLARDLRILVRQGYRIQSVQPLDMFPQTYHIETVTVLTR